MGSAVKVFVSATTADLLTLRGQVTGWLVDMSWLPVVQDHFPPDDRTVMTMLRSKIGECDAVIHIVGECYGAEPRVPPKDEPRRSYTQIEAAIARRQRKRLFTVLLDEHFQYDTHTAEPEEPQALQREYRQDVAGSDHLYIPCRTAQEVESEVRKLRIEIDKLRKSRRGIVALLLLLLIGVLGLGLYYWHTRREIQADIGDVRGVLVQVMQQTQDGPADNSPGSQTRRLHAALYRIALERGVDPDALTASFNRFMAETAANRAASLRDQAIAAFAKQDYAGSEKLATNAIRSIRAGIGDDEAKRPLLRDMYTLAASAAAAQHEWGRAEADLRAVLQLTRPDTEAALYAKTGLALGEALDNQQRVGDAADMISAVRTTIADQLGRMGEAGVTFLNGVARLQLFSHRLADCAATLRESMGLSQIVHSPYSDGLRVYALTLLGDVLAERGRQVEAADAKNQADRICAVAGSHITDATESIESIICEYNRTSANTDYALVNIIDATIEAKQETADLERYARRTEYEIALIQADTTAVDEANSILEWLIYCQYFMIAFPVVFLAVCARFWGQQWLFGLRSWWLLRKAKLLLREAKRIEARAEHANGQDKVRQLKALISLHERVSSLHERRIHFIEAALKLDDQWPMPWIPRHLKLVMGVWGGLALVAALGCFGGDYVIGRITHEPQISQQLIAASRDRVAFTEKAFGRFSDLNLDSLADLAAVLGRHDNETSEAEALYLQVISLRQTDAGFGTERMATLMKELASVLRDEGKTEEAEQWTSQARRLRAGVPDSR